MDQIIPSHSPWLAWSIAVARPVRCAELPQAADGTSIESPPGTGGTGLPAVVTTALLRGTLATGQVTTGDLLIRPKPPFPSSLSENLEKSDFLAIFASEGGKEQVYFSCHEKTQSPLAATFGKLAFRPWPLASSQPVRAEGRTGKSDGAPATPPADFSSFAPQG